MNIPSLTSSNYNLNREDSFTNLSDIIIGERAETFSTTTQMIDKEIKRRLDELTKRNDELAVELKKLKQVKAFYSNVFNKWAYIYSQCCNSTCVKTTTPNTVCQNKWGFIQITSDTNIKYNCKTNRMNKESIIAAEITYKQPDSSKLCANCATYTLYYYEIKLIIEKGKQLIEIGLSDCLGSWDCIYFCLTGGYISCFDNKHKKDKFINLSSFSFNNEDIIGCGVVYPPPNINNKLPYIFFTKNGELIGKAIEVNGNQNLRPSCILKCCSIETNFGEDLNSKPFKYDIGNHMVTEEFYKDEEFSEMN